MARILVVDDEKNIRLMIELALGQSGHTVVLAADGPEGLSKYGDGSDFDLVLLDQRMPGMEGLEVLRELRKKSPESKIIMITAFGTIDLAVDAMKAGATDFLRKPFTTDMLRNAVQSSLAGITVEHTAQPSHSPVIYWTATLNGFSISSKPNSEAWKDGDLRYPFDVRSPVGFISQCAILVQAEVVAQIKDRIGDRAISIDEAFWRNLCSHVMANYIWQNPELPSDGCVQTATLTKELANWIDSLPTY